jgi:uncharacterized phage infection (PIP) family protein YhgE
MTKTIPPKNEGTVKDKEAGDPLNQARLAEGASGDPDSVDRIRDILFGAQTRQFEQKFNLLEETIRKEVANLREWTHKSIETLENYTKKGLESLVTQLKSEQTERSEAVNRLAAQGEASAKTLEKKIYRLDETTHAAQHDLQEQILQQSKALMKEIQQKHDDLAAVVKKAMDELRKEKTDRIALGNLFNEVGLRLKEEFKIPDGK